MNPPIVGGLLVRRDPTLRILLGKRAATRVFYPSVWDVPGGHAEPGEGAEATLIRELREEIGVVPTQWRLRLQVELPEPAMPLLVYAVTAWTSDPSNLQPAEHAEIRWFTIDEARS